MGFRIEKFSGPDAYRRELERLASLAPGRFAFHTDRKSFDGEFDLYWITVGDVTKPAIFFVSVLHAKNEWYGAHLILEFAKKLIDPADDQAGFNRSFLDDFSFIAVPMANPWGYFTAPEGRHYNANSAAVPGIESADWHDMSEYDHYYGVNLNRNFDWNWERYPNLPWSVRKYWNGRDYGFANYFMAPFYVDEQGVEVYDPFGEHAHRVLRPDPDVYDYKGSAPFSEPETRLIRDLVTGKYHVVGFADWHTMNPWHARNTSYISRNASDRETMMKRVDAGIERVNRRHPDPAARIPSCRHRVMEEYDGNAPYAVNWAQNRAGIRSFGWEIGTRLPVEMWTDAYLEMFYRSISWMVGAAREAGIRGRMAE